MSMADYFALSFKNFVLECVDMVVDDLGDIVKSMIGFVRISLIQLIIFNLDMPKLLTQMDLKIHLISILVKLDWQFIFDKICKSYGCIVKDILNILIHLIF